MDKYIFQSIIQYMDNLHDITQMLTVSKEFKENVLFILKHGNLTYLNDADFIRVMDFYNNDNSAMVIRDCELSVKIR